MSAPLPEWVEQQRSTATRLGRLGQHLTVVGSIHGDHWDQSAFPVEALDSALARTAPDLVLLEQRDGEPEYDGPPEMLYLRRRCEDELIDVLGVDWWDTSREPSTSWEEREDRIAANVADACDHLRAAPMVLLFIGSSHVEPLVQRLTKLGWARDSRVAPSDIFGATAPYSGLPSGFLDLLSERSQAEAASTRTTHSPERQDNHRDNARYFLSLIHI